MPTLSRALYGLLLMSAGAVAAYSVVTVDVQRLWRAAKPPVVDVVTPAKTPVVQAVHTAEAGLDAERKPASVDAFAWERELQSALPEIIPPGVTIGLYVEDPKTGATFSHLADRPMYLASGIKLLFLVEAHRQLHTGELELDETVRYGWRDVRDGAPSMNRQKVGSRLRVDELLTFMIRDSDNAASDLLFEKLGKDNILKTLVAEEVRPAADVVNLVHIRHEVYATLDKRARQLKAWQVRDVRWRDGHHPRLDLLQKHIGRPYGDYDERDLEAAYDAYYETQANHFAMRDVGRLLSRMTRGEVVSTEASAAMLQQLGSVWNSGHRIDGLVDEKWVMHKTGTQRRRICDLAVIELSDGHPLVVTIAVAGPRHEAAEAVLRDVVQEVLELERSERQQRGQHVNWAAVQ